jgi:hypothetical protein
MDLSQPGGGIRFEYESANEGWRGLNSGKRFNPEL